MTGHLTEGVDERQSLVHSRRFVDSPGMLCYPPNNTVKLHCGGRTALVQESMGSGFLLKTSRNFHRARLLLGLLTLCASLMALFPADSLSKVKPPRVPRPEPQLKIVGLNITPTPYALGNGSLQFSVTVQLPKEVDGSTILEVTSLISSPSKSSLRFLTYRQPIQVPPAVDGETGRSKVSVELAWDGQDHRKQLAGVGMYSYEVRTKLLANGEKGLRTVMVAWPKRGLLEVK
jgi:hypothetical protein